MPQNIFNVTRCGLDLSGKTWAELAFFLSDHGIDKVDREGVLYAVKNHIEAGNQKFRVLVHDFKPEDFGDKRRTEISYAVEIVYMDFGLWIRFNPSPIYRMCKRLEDLSDTDLDIIWPAVTMYHATEWYDEQGGIDMNTWASAVALERTRRGLSNA